MHTSIPHAMTSAGADRWSGRWSPGLARALLVSVVVAFAVAAALATDAATASQATAQAGADLTRLMRAMAAIKALMAACAAAAVLWRLGTPVRLLTCAAYAGACGAMAAGPSLIWAMVHPGLGALLLHGGLFTTVVLLWRDPAIGVRLNEMIVRRASARPILD